MKRVVPVAVLAGLTAVFAAAMACGGDQEVVMTDAGNTTPTDDAGVVTGKTVKVTYQGASTVVALNQLTTVDVNGAPKAKLSDVVAAALPNKTLDQIVAADFIAEDGYSPTQKENCDGMLPVAGANFAKGYVDPSTRTITWDESLAFPGCLKITNAAEIVIAEAPAPGKILKVTYAGASTDVDLNRPTAVEVGGVNADKLSDVVALAVTAKSADQLQVTGIVASDGYNPATKPTCQANFPVDGAKLAQGFIERETRNITWDAALAMPGCMGVDDAAELILEDKPVK